MRHLLCSAVMALALVTGFATTASAMDKGDEAPNFQFESAWNTLAGSSQLTDYRGKIVLLEVWKIH